MNRNVVTLTLRDYDIAEAIIVHLRSLNADQGNNDNVTTIPEATYDRS